MIRSVICRNVDLTRDDHVVDNGDTLINLHHVASLDKFRDKNGNPYCLVGFQNKQYRLIKCEPKTLALMMTCAETMFKMDLRDKPAEVMAPVEARNNIVPPSEVAHRVQFPEVDNDDLMPDEFKTKHG